MCDYLAEARRHWGRDVFADLAIEPGYEADIRRLLGVAFPAPSTSRMRILEVGGSLGLTAIPLSDDANVTVLDNPHAAFAKQVWDYFEAKRCHIWQTRNEKDTRGWLSAMDADFAHINCVGGASLFPIVRKYGRVMFGPETDIQRESFKINLLDGGMWRSGQFLLWMSWAAIEDARDAVREVERACL